MAGPTAGVLLVAAAVVTAGAAVVDPPEGPSARPLVLVVPVLLVLIGVFLRSPRGRRPSPVLSLIPLGALVAIAVLDIATKDAGISGHIFFCVPVLYAASQLRTGAAVVITAAAIALDALVAFTLVPPAQALTDVLYMATTMTAIAVVLIRKGRSQDAVVRQLQEGKDALLRQATHDALTGLPNRVLFHQQVHEALLAQPRSPSEGPGDSDRRRRDAPDDVAVLFCDLDDFKAVNDSLGHRAGDELLVTIAGRLRSRLRAQDVVARLGGDEFAVLLHGVDPEAARVMAGNLLEAVATPVPVAGHHVHVAASIGITLTQAGADKDVHTLVREADIAMYAAKAAGRGRCVEFTEQMLTAQVEQASLVQDLHGAVSRGEFSVHYQPVVDLRSRLVDGLEALARWTHPVRGPVSPETFIPLAEQAGLIDEIGAFVLAEVTAHSRPLSAAAGKQLSIGINMSAAQLVSTRILDMIPSGQTETMQLIIEVTESTLIRADVVPVLEELRRRGILIAMDDFGVGQSSIAALRLMPVDIIKLDRAFTVEVSSDRRAAAIVRSMAAMAGDLGLPLVAEGIETTEQLEALTGIGCNYGQGYLLARPVALAAMVAFLDGQRVPAGAGSGDASRG
ncbi:EAL domain-containing protein [Actinotalea sp. C106]|uniref:putative bifunctional diguanylate cyclase/phosphodiesterase n=1 Tax=Actinotalea sp. C106 TaxID=2908644 RepID=UPI002028A54F|nr:EAL domain-containing protein [Actinotalea sp. C106]